MRTEKCRQPLRVHIYRYSCACTAMHKHGRQTNNCKKHCENSSNFQVTNISQEKEYRKKRSLTKILVFCLVFSGAGSLFRDFSFLLQRFFTSIKKGKIHLDEMLPLKKNCEILLQCRLKCRMIAILDFSSSFYSNLHYAFLHL